LDKPEPVTPVNGASPGVAEGPKTVGGWFAANLLPLAFVAGVIALIVWRGLVVWDVALAVLGLGLVIFIHELGHFLAAKFCDVHVETFSVGFGKAIPGCQFRYGETTYKIGWIPLGGYVKMVGEGDNADSEEADEDPRSFKNKSVWQRMIIISAGVVMNLILGCACFMWAYSHGVEEEPAIVGIVVVGSPAWEQDLRVGDQIVQIGSTTRPTFPDIRPTVMSAARGEAVPFVIEDRNGGTRPVDIVPRRNPEDLYPLVGINPIEQLMLQKTRRGGPRPVRRNSPASEARAVEDNSEFQGGDRIVASSFDPANPAAVADIPTDPRAPSKLDTYHYLRNEFRMRGKPMTVRVDRDGQPLTFVVPPGTTKVLPDVRFQMGRIAALRGNGPAAQAKPVEPATDGGLRVARADAPGSGDKIIAIEITPRGAARKLRYVDELTQPKPADVDEVPFDTFKLGYELETWAQTAEDLTVRLTVLRPPTGPGKMASRVTYDLRWDPALVFNGEVSGGLSTPLAISGLGLAYFVETTIDAEGPNPAGGLKKGDIVTEVRPRRFDDKGEPSPDDWLPLEQHQGAFLHALFQGAASPEFDLRVTRGGTDQQEVSVQVVPDPRGWPAVDRGFNFPFDTRLQKADDPWDALGMGLHRTWRTVKVIYQTLYATIFRQISAKTMSGPLSIANASYKIAGYDFWQFLIFIGLININLAVVNFLPIPLLDGGHMMFLIYEKVRGKPPPDKLVEWSLWVGLALILSLMVFVIFLDVRKLFF
jgi:regulator of sigma E protease